MRYGQFNVATWFDAKSGGYWEYMDHEFASKPPSPDNPVIVKHIINLPELGADWITIYGVTHRRHFKMK
jgi:hypothetical protein